MTLSRALVAEIEARRTDASWQETSAISKACVSALISGNRSLHKGCSNSACQCHCHGRST